MKYAFTFDASACSGCKACQVACIDKNNLPIGVNWRRVYEVCGGEWSQVYPQAAGPGVWENTVFAYNLSLACNHCDHPKCAGVCPTDAYVVREDGIVYVDKEKCMGCGYCSWACPYAAPRYNSEAGYMTKCNFCYDSIDLGLAPACVVACPMRVLDFYALGSEQEPVEKGISLWKSAPAGHPHPLPTYSHTEPHLAINQHVGMDRKLEAKINNREEVRVKNARSEFPLVVFSLAVQMAAGMSIWMASMNRAASYVPELLLIGIALAVGCLSSFLHLGNPINAWRSINHLKKSWLSREVLFLGVFGLVWALTLFLDWQRLSVKPAISILALSGAVLVYSMARVYRIYTIPGWDTWRTNLGFFVTALLLGICSLLIIPWREELPMPEMLVGMIIGGLFGVQLLIHITRAQPAQRLAGRLRSGLIISGLLGALGMAFTNGETQGWIKPAIFMTVLLEEGIGRWGFYGIIHDRAL